MRSSQQSPTLSLIFKFLIYSVLVVLFVGGVGLSWWGFQGLWNLVVAGIFHGPNISYWQSAAICILGSFIGGWFRSTGKS